MDQQKTNTRDDNAIFECGNLSDFDEAGHHVNVVVVAAGLRSYEEIG